MLIRALHRFTVYPRARRETMDFKVKSVLRGTEHEGTENICGFCLSLGYD